MNTLSRGILMMLFAALTLIGCGGGGDSTPATTNVTGKFIDATVFGMDYKCGTSTTVSGTTNSTGQYTCPAGQAVAFYIGSILIGSVSSPMAIVTPLDLVSNGANPDNATVQNIVRFLMSISSTDPAATATGTITIDAAVAAAAASQTINFATITATALDTLITIVKPGATVYTSAQAKTHISASINGLFAGNYAGTFSGAASGSWSLAIDANGAVTGDSDAGAITGNMGTTLSTGSTYAFTGNAGGVPWAGTLNVSTKAFSGTWNDGAGNSGTFTGTASTPAVGVTTCVPSHYSVPVHAPTATELAVYAKTYNGSIGNFGPNIGDPFVATGSAAFVLSAAGGLTYNGATKLVTSMCLENTPPVHPLLYVEMQPSDTVDFFADGGFTGTLANGANFNVVQGGSCATVAGCGTGGTGGTTPTVTGYSPNTGAVGTTVTITGTNLGLGFPPAPIVKFGTMAVTTPLTFSGQTSVSFAVPAGLAVGAHTITIGGATGTPITVGTFTVTAAGGGTGGAGLTLSPAWRGFSAIPNGPVNQLVTGLGAGLVYDDSLALSRFAINLAYVGANAVIDLQIADLSNGQSALGGGCGLASAFGPYPTCASMGISFNRTSGNVSFVNTSIGGSTINGTLTFTPF